MELVKSIQSTLYERVVSPLAGVFLISWAIMHYDLIMMLMSKHDIMYKSQMIFEYMVIDSKNNWSGSEYVDYAPYYFALIKPLLYSLLALITYPIFSVPAYFFSMTGKYCLQRIRRLFDSHTPVSAKAFQEIQDLLDAQSSKYRERTIKNDAELESYKKVNQEIKSDSLKLSSRIIELESKLVIQDDDARETAAQAQYDEDMSAQAEAFHENESERKSAMEALAAVDALNIIEEEEEGGAKDYVSLFFDSADSELSRSVMLDLPVNKQVDVDYLLKLSFKPKTESNRIQMKKIIKVMEMYHIVSYVDFQPEIFSTDIVFQLTDQGRMLQKSLNEGVGVFRDVCEKLDGI